MNPTSSTNMGNSRPTATSDTSFKFQQTLAKPFSNLVESSLTTRRLFGHSSKLATTKSPNISPIIAPSRLSLSNLPQPWRSMPPATVSNVEIDTIEKNIARKLKISQKTTCPHTTSMAVSEDPPHTTGRKKSSVKKLADFVQKKSSKFRQKLRSAVVRPRMAKKDATQDENSKKPSVNVESSAGNNETNIPSKVATSEQVDEKFTKPDTPEMDENSPQLDLMLAQHSKKSNYCDINIENDTDSSMKGAAEEVSNRSLGEIFTDKAMFDSSHNSGQDPYNILRTDKLPSDLESVSPIIFPALGADIGTNVAEAVSLSAVEEDKISEDNQEDTQIGDAQDDVQNMELERKQTLKVSIEKSGSGFHQEKGKDESSENEAIRYLICLKRIIFTHHKTPVQRSDTHPYLETTIPSW